MGKEEIAEAIAKIKKMSDDKQKYLNGECEMMTRHYFQLIINADCNSVANILRKAMPNAWNHVNDFSCLASPKVYGFHELNPQCNSVEGIVAA